MPFTISVTAASFIHSNCKIKLLFIEINQNYISYHNFLQNNTVCVSQTFILGVTDGTKLDMFY